MNEDKRLMLDAAREIRELRRMNDLMAAQVSVVEVFRAALLGPPRSQGQSVDVAWVLERRAEAMGDE